MNCALAVSFFEAMLIRSHRQLDLTVEYLPPAMSKLKPEEGTEEQYDTLSYNSTCYDFIVSTIYYSVSLLLAF